MLMGNRQFVHDKDKENTRVKFNEAEIAVVIDDDGGKRLRKGPRSILKNRSVSPERAIVPKADEEKEALDPKRQAMKKKLKQLTDRPEDLFSKERLVYIPRERLKPLTEDVDAFVRSLIVETKSKSKIRNIKDLLLSIKAFAPKAAVEVMNKLRSVAIFSTESLYSHQVNMKLLMQYVNCFMVKEICLNIS
jgi:hypothetical protein